jgi:hypothetical protein
VQVAPAERQNLAEYTEAVAALDGYVNAEIRARVKGFLRRQTYKDGSVVKPRSRRRTRRCSSNATRDSSRRG